MWVEFRGCSGIHCEGLMGGACGWSFEDALTNGWDLWVELVGGVLSIFVCLLVVDRLI